ncbi:MAG: serine hydroxymethyltransferase [Candidatus Micrarchaeota archaeon]
MWEMEESVEGIERIVEAQRKWRENECINLIASENVMSKRAHAGYSSSLMHRYAEGLPRERYYQGTVHADELEELCIKLAKKVFGCAQVDARLISGATANMAVFSALGKQGDLLISPGTPAGAHISHEEFGCAGIAGLKVEHFVFDEKKYDVDIDATKKKILEKKPKIVTLGGSVIPFPFPVRELSEAAREVNARVMYDGAHVLGLIAGKRFQDPLREGAEVITASTHKTFPGPQGGIVLANMDEKTFSKIQFRVFPGLVSNHHLHRLPALAITLLEMKQFGEEYARQTIKNAKTLARALKNKGMNVLGEEKDFTESHQVVADVVSLGGGKKVAEALESANIIMNKNLLAWDSVNNAQNPSGIRLGVQEMTRFGMKEKEMEIIADFIMRAAEKGEVEKVKKEVVEFRKNFLDVRYCF